MKQELINKIDDLVELNLIKGVKIFDDKEHGIIPFIIIDILKEDYNLKNRIIKEFESEESIYADVVSSLDNPDCSCRKRFITYLSNNWSICWKKVLKLLNYKECDVSKLNKIFEVIKNYTTNYNTKDAVDKQEPTNDVKPKEEDSVDKGSLTIKIPKGSKIQDFISIENTNKSGMVAPPPEKGVMGLNYEQIMNIIPNINTLAGKFVTISTQSYQNLFLYIKENNCSYTGVSIHKEHDILHLFFY